MAGAFSYASDWESTWAPKVTTAPRAVRLIPRGHRILIGSGAAEPLQLVEAMVGASASFADNEVVHLLTLGPAPYTRPEFSRAFRHVAFFIGANVRSAVQDGRADFIPVFLSEIPQLIRSGRFPIDVALVQVSPPDRHGYVSLGVSVDVVRATVDTARIVIAEVNPRMPRTSGDSFVHASRLTCMVPVDTPLLELTSEPPGEVEREIGRHVASLVPDGATLQVGIGKIPNAVLAALHDRRNLGIHTEMLSDGIMTLAETGAVNGQKKDFLPGKMVTSFIMGSQRLYDWSHEHPAIEMRPSEFTNDPFVIARHSRMISINTALAVDLTGQVAADSIHGRPYSGIGGQVDFIRGAARSLGGKAIIALRSTAKNGTLSRIQSALEAGAAVVTSRGDVRYVVTEYGVADMWGKSVRERATALIDIAHPDFRNDLLNAGKARHYVFPDQLVPKLAKHRVEDFTVMLPAGRSVLVRGARATDASGVHRLFYSSPDHGSALRFLGLKEDDSPQAFQSVLESDEERCLVLVACDASSSELVGTAQYELNRATEFAAVGLIVRDDWKGLGVGTILMRRLIEVA
ncbi:MAG: GNAT family N-acetyltransferase, partial [Myxococcaceae bacterium]